MKQVQWVEDIIGLRQRSLQHERDLHLCRQRARCLDKARNAKTKAPEHELEPLPLADTVTTVADRIESPLQEPPSERPRLRPARSPAARVDAQLRRVLDDTTGRKWDHDDMMSPFFELDAHAIRHEDPMLPHVFAQRAGFQSQWLDNHHRQLQAQIVNNKPLGDCEWTAWQEWDRWHCDNAKTRLAHYVDNMVGKNPTSEERRVPDEAQRWRGAGAAVMDQPTKGSLGFRLRASPPIPAIVEFVEPGSWAQRQLIPWVDELVWINEKPVRNMSVKELNAALQEWPLHARFLRNPAKLKEKEVQDEKSTAQKYEEKDPLLEHESDDTEPDEQSEANAEESTATDTSFELYVLSDVRRIGFQIGAELPQSLTVVIVENNSLAHQKGLLANVDELIALNGKPVDNMSQEQLLRTLDFRPLSLIFMRNSHLFQDMKAQKALVQFHYVAGENVRSLGFGTNAMPPAPILVGRVEIGSWADEQGMMAGIDEIVAINGEPVSSWSEQQVIEALSERPVTFTCDRYQEPEAEVSTESRNENEEEPEYQEPEAEVSTESRNDNEEEPERVQEFDLVVPQDVKSLGFLPVALPPSDLIIDHVSPASWAEVEGLLAGVDCLIAVDNMPVSIMTEMELRNIMRRRPVRFTFARNAEFPTPAGAKAHLDQEKTSDEQAFRVDDLVRIMDDPVRMAAACRRYGHIWSAKLFHMNGQVYAISEIVSPEIIRVYDAKSDESGFRNGRIFLPTECVEPQAGKLSIGQLVERRDIGATWGTGYVTSLDPLKVTIELDPNARGYAWHEVRPLEVPEPGLDEQKSSQQSGVLIVHRDGQGHDQVVFESDDLSHEGRADAEKRFFEFKYYHQAFNEKTSQLSLVVNGKIVKQYPHETLEEWLAQPATVGHALSQSRATLMEDFNISLQLDAFPYAGTRPVLDGPPPGIRMNEKLDYNVADSLVLRQEFKILLASGAEEDSARAAAQSTTGKHHQLVNLIQSRNARDLDVEFDAIRLHQKCKGSWAPPAACPWCGRRAYEVELSRSLAFPGSALRCACGRHFWHEYPLPPGSGLGVGSINGKYPVGAKEALANSDFLK